MEELLMLNNITIGTLHNKHKKYFVHEKITKHQLLINQNNLRAYQLENQEIQSEKNNFCKI